MKFINLDTNDLCYLNDVAGIGMGVCAIVVESFERSFALYRDLIESVDVAVLDSRLPGLRSNTLGQQLWCVVGARESYRRAIAANEWAGFSCSLETTTDKTLVANALSRSAALVREVLTTIEIFTEIQNRLVIDLLEHEAAHQGQLIRYLYGLELTIPDSWKARYALT